MTLYQNQSQLTQLQEDFLANSDRLLSRKVESMKKPRPQSFDEAAEAAKEAKPEREDFKNKVSMTSFDDDELDVSEEAAGYSIGYVLDNIHVVIKNAEVFFSSVIDEAEKTDFASKTQAILRSIKNYVYSIPEHEEEFKILTAGCLFFYGGSWTLLASLMAAVELFDTKEELAAAYLIGEKFMSVEDYDKEDDVTPSQLMQTFKKVGMQFALMLAVLHSDAWAEICVSFAFASKLNTIVNMEVFYEEQMDLSAADSEWLSLISSISSTILSFIIYGVWPGLVVCMYMAYIGLQCLMTVPYQIGVPYGFMSCLTFKELLTNPSNQTTLWVCIIFTALWQAYCSYTGALELLSWLMFLLPAVQLFNIISGYFIVNISSLKF